MKTTPALITITEAAKLTGVTEGQFLEMCRKMREANGTAPSRIVTSKGGYSFELP